MNIYIGADHNGYGLKSRLVSYLSRAGYEVIDTGDDHLDPDDDYPQFAGRVVVAMQGSDDIEARGILICGSGQGMCMTANRFKGIRAALGYNQESIKSARNDDDANVLCLPSKQLDQKDVNVVVETFLNTPFGAAARYRRRIQEMDEL